MKEPRFSWSPRRRARDLAEEPYRRPRKAELPPCGAKTRTPMPCPSCSAEARANRPCPSCGAEMPERLCQAKPVRHPTTGRPLNGRCRLHGGTQTRETEPERQRQSQDGGHVDEDLDDLGVEPQDDAA